MKRFQSFLYSGLIHGLLVLSAFLITRVDEKKPDNLVNFEITSLPKSALGATQHLGAKPKAASSVKASTASGKQTSLFGKSYVENSKARNESSLESSQGTGDYRESSSYDADAGSFLADTDQWAYFQQVFTKIDEQLLFDSILAQYNHFGYVFVEFEVGPDGRFIDKSIRVTAQDSILKVHALRAMRKGLAQEFPEEKRNPTGKSAWFHAKFEFLSADEGWNFKKQKDFGKPKFLFRRASSEKPIPNNLKDQLLTGGLHYDVFVMAERWEKYNKKKRLKAGEFDPFAPYKADPDYNL